MTTRKKGWVYLVHAQETDLYKIGITFRTPEEMLRELNAKQLPYNYEIVYAVFVENPHEIKSYLHNKFSEYRHNNEWFEFTGKRYKHVIDCMNGKEDKNNFPFVEIILSIVAISLIFYVLSHNPRYTQCVFNGGGKACEVLKND